jgi:EmrB/QacA subfamily drug resistance transporter
MSQQQKWVLGLAAVGAFMIALDVLVVSTALSTIQRQLHGSIETLEWTMNAYNLTFAALLLTGAAVGDRFGRKRMFVVGMAIFTLSSVACALSPSIGWLIAARAVQGLGAAIMMPLALTLISAAFPPQQRGRALGIFSGVAGLGTFSGPFIGGVVAEGLAWEWIFWINIPVGVATILLVRARIEESHGPNSATDLGGLLLSGAGGFGIVWALIRGNQAGWGSAEVLSLLIGGVLMMALFVLWENRTEAPMLPMRFFKIRAFTTANIANFTLWAGVYGVLFMLAQFLQVAQGYGPLGAGLRLISWTGTVMVCAPIAGALADRLGERPFMAGGLLLQTIGMTWLALVARADMSYSSMVLPLVIGGCGVSMGMPVAQKAVVGAVAPQEIGKASAAINTLRIFGGAFGIAIMSAVFSSYGSFASPTGFADGFAPAIGVAAGLAFVGAIAGLGLPGRRRGGPPMMAPPTPAAAPGAGGQRGALLTRPR